VTARRSATETQPAGSPEVPPIIVATTGLAGEACGAKASHVGHRFVLEHLHFLRADPVLAREGANDLFFAGIERIERCGGSD